MRLILAGLVGALIALLAGASLLGWLLEALLRLFK